MIASYVEVCGMHHFVALAQPLVITQGGFVYELLAIPTVRLPTQLYGSSAKLQLFCTATQKPYLTLFLFVYIMSY